MQPPPGFVEVPKDFSLPNVLALAPHVHPRASVAWWKPPAGGLGFPTAAVAFDARYFAHRPDWAPWPDALPTAGTGDVGFGAVARGWLSSEATGTALGVGINPARAEELANRWPTNDAANAEFLAALHGADAVELDLVFMRAHALHRWDLLPGWYAQTWLERGTVRSFKAPTGKPAAPFVLAPAPAVGAPGSTVYLVTGFELDGSPRFATAPSSWKPANGLAGTSPVAFTWPPSYWSDPLSNALRPWLLAPPARDVARGDGFDTLPAADALDAHGGAWRWFWSKASTLTLPPPGYGLTAQYRGAHNWAHLWKTQSNSVEGTKWVPIGASYSKPPEKWLGASEWKGPYVEQLIARAFEADTLRDSQAWQERASVWWQGYLEWCPQVGMPHTAGHLPPLWQRPTVSYRPHWWVVDADFVRARLDVAAPTIQTPTGPVPDWDWHADTFRAAIAEWIAQGAHVVDPYEMWGHTACENWLEGPDFVDILGLLFALGVVATIAPAMAAQLVGAFGFAGTTLGGVLADLGATGLGSGLSSEATGGTFGEGIGDALEDPLEALVDYATGELAGELADVLDIDAGFVEDVLEDPLEALEDLGAGTLGELLGVDAEFVEDVFEDPLEVLEDYGAGFVEDVLDIGAGTIDDALDVLEGEDPLTMDFFDEFIPDSFGEALDLAGDAIDLYEGVQDVLDLFDDDADFLGGIGGVFGGGADGGGQTPPVFEQDLENDLSLGLSSKPKKGAGELIGSLAPVLVVALLAFVVVKA